MLRGDVTIDTDIDDDNNIDDDYVEVQKDDCDDDRNAKGGVDVDVEGDDGNDDVDI